MNDNYNLQLIRTMVKGAMAARSVVNQMVQLGQLEVFITELIDGSTTPNKRYEHTTISVNPEMLEAGLKDRERDGWEFASFTFEPGSRELIVVFKRAVS